MGLTKTTFIAVLFTCVYSCSNIAFWGSSVKQATVLITAATKPPVSQDPTWVLVGDRIMLGIKNSIAGALSSLTQHPVRTGVGALALGAAAGATWHYWDTIKMQTNVATQTMGDVYNKCPVVWKSVACLVAATSAYFAYKNGYFLSASSQKAIEPAVKTVTASATVSSLFTTWMLGKKEATKEGILASNKQAFTEILAAMKSSPSDDYSAALIALIESYQDSGLTDIINGNKEKKIMGFIPAWQARNESLKKGWKERGEARAQLESAYNNALMFVKAAELTKSNAVRQN